MTQTERYQITLPQIFDGPYDLLLHLIERDELDIYDIPILKILNDFLNYIHHQQSLNIELSSEFILFVATLMRIKAKMLLPRKEKDAEGNELDPRMEIVNAALEYKKHKQISILLAELEAQRICVVKRGNITQELNTIGQQNAEGTEIQTLTLFKLMKSFERVLTRFNDKNNKPVHVVTRYNYTIEQSRNYLLNLISTHKSVSFEKIFEQCRDRIQAIFIFLSMLELIQQSFFIIIMGEMRNNFIVEYISPENRPII